MVDYRFGVVNTDYALGLFLERHRSGPRFVDVRFREVFQRGHILADVVAVGVGLLTKSNGAINSEVLVKEGGAAKPHPVTSVEGPVTVDQILIKYS